MLNQAPIITQEGIRCLDLSFPNKYGEIKVLNIDMSMVMEWAARTKPNQIECGEGELILLPVWEFLNSDWFLNHEENQLSLINHYLNTL